MRELFITLGMLVCLFAPTFLFSVIGYKALERVGKRPSRGGKAMIILVTELTMAAAGVISLQMFLLKIYTMR